jgi:hypothetical protein
MTLNGPLPFILPIQITEEEKDNYQFDSLTNNHPLGSPCNIYDEEINHGK